MAENRIPWWRRALNLALGSLRSGFGWFDRPARLEEAKGREGPHSKVSAILRSPDGGEPCDAVPAESTIENPSNPASSGVATAERIEPALRAATAGVEQNADERQPDAETFMDASHRGAGMNVPEETIIEALAPAVEALTSAAEQGGPAAPPASETKVPFEEWMTVDSEATLAAAQAATPAEEALTPLEQAMVPAGDQDASEPRLDLRADSDGTMPASEEVVPEITAATELEEPSRPEAPAGAELAAFAEGSASIQHSAPREDAAPPDEETVPVDDASECAPCMSGAGADDAKPEVHSPHGFAIEECAVEDKASGDLRMEPLPIAAPAAGARSESAAEAPAIPAQLELIPKPPVDDKSAAKLAEQQKRRKEAEKESPFSVMVGQVYEGPLDLLLDLIRKQDIDIYDIPIAKITAQFLAYVNQLKASDVDVAGEFIYTASLLIHIKSRMLLPRTADAPGEAIEDPRRELVERLLEHERFKNAAQMLQQKQMMEAASWTNPGHKEFAGDEGAEPELAADTVDLVRVFRDILERARNRPVLEVIEDTVTVGQMIQFLRRRLTMEDRPIALRKLLSQTRSERALIAMFLALLELVRLQAILLRQDGTFGDIFIKKHAAFDSVMDEGLVGARDDWR